MISLIKGIQKRPILLIMVIVLFVSAGLASLHYLPMSLMPRIQKHGLSIIVKYPGQSPWRIERVITIPIEEAIAPIGGIKDITSVSKEGESRIHVTFNNDAQMKYRILEVREKIDPIRAKFPRDVNEPEVHSFNDDDKPVVIINVKSNVMDSDQLYQLIDKKFKKMFQSIDGVGEVIIVGGRKRDITVKALEGKLVSRTLYLQSIGEVISDNNITVPLGSIKDGKKYSFSINGKFKNIIEISNLPLKRSKEGTIIYIKDVASVKDYDGKKENYSRRNGKDSISIYIKKSGSANIVSLCNEINKTSQKLTTKKYSFNVTYDQSKYITDAISNLLISCLFGIIIAIAVLFLFFKNWQSSLPIIISIPLSLLAVFIYMYLKKMTINVISLSGLAIAVGLVVDNAIVVQETIISSFEKGHDSIEKIASIGRALLASTLTTVCIFVPIYIFSTDVSKIFSDMAGAVIVSLIASLVCALFIVPSIGLRFIKNHDEDKQRNNFNFLKKINTYLTYDFYKKICEYVNESKKLIFASMILIFILTISLSFMLKRTYIPPVKKSEIYGSLDFKPGTGLKESLRATRKLEKMIQKSKLVNSVTTKIEPGKTDFIFKVDENKNLNYVSQDLKNLCQPHLNSGVSFIMQQERSGESTKKLKIEISGKDIYEIRDTAKKLASLIQKKIDVSEIIYHFRDGRPELRIQIDRNKATDGGYSIREIGSHVRNVLYGPVATKYITKNEVDVRTSLHFAQNPTIENIKNLIITNKDGKKRQLRSLASFSETNGISTIWRKNKERMETMSIKTTDGDIVTLSKKIKKIIPLLNLSPDIIIRFGDSLKKVTEANKELIISLFLAIALVYMVTASLFESLKLPFLVILTIPVGAIGALLSLVIFNEPISVPSLMGLVVLVGIVVNNSILLIDTFNKNTVENIEDIFRLAFTRARSISITTLTTVLGMVPLLFSGAMWFGFALTVISGLLVSAIFVLLLLPIIYFITIA